MTSIGKQAFAVHEDIIKLEHALTKNFLALGQRLHEVKENRLFEVMDYPSFQSYISSPEISLSQTTAYSLIDIYKTFIVQLGVSEAELIPIGRTKLERLLPVIDEENKEEWMPKAEALSTSDLDKELQSFRKKPVFEYKYSRALIIKFEGDTKMEMLVEKKLNLIEWYCSKCDNHFWTHKKADSCPYCGDKPYENGHIKYGENYEVSGEETD